MSPDETAPDELEEGVALVLRAEDRGDWRAVARGLARHPTVAPEVDLFLNVQDKPRPVAAPVAPARRAEAKASVP